MCSDVDRNAKAGFIHPILGECSRDLNITNPHHSWSEFPRFIVRNEDESNSGRWVNLLIEGELIVTIFIDEVSQILKFADSLCTVCSFPRGSCVCGLNHNPSNKLWRFVDNDDNNVITTRQLNQIMSRKKCQLHLVLEFEDEVVLQVKKSYTDILTEPEMLEPIVKVLEDAGALIYGFKRSRSITDVIIVVGNFVRSMTGRSNLYFMKDLVTMIKHELQEFLLLQSKGHWTDTLSDLYDNYSKCKDTKLAKRLKKVFNHLIAHCVYHKLGIEVDPVQFALMEKTQIRPNMLNYITFIDAVAGLITYLLKAGRQCLIAGSIEPLFLDESSVGEWLLRTKQIKVDSEFLGNPAAIGMSIHSFLERLEKVIVDSKSVMKFLAMGSVEYRLVQGSAMEMDAIQKRYLSITAAQSVRKQPFAVALFGTPGVGKTSVQEMLTNFDALRRGRDPSAGFVFHHESSDEYMTNFKSYMHTIIMDDVAQHAPNKVQGVDPGISLMLKFINNQPMTPTQASLDDKGKTPILADFVIATTNCHDMNLPIYYPASYAPMRRLRWRIEIIVKEAYRKEGGSDIDPVKANSHTTYPDYWRFVIAEAVPVSVGSQQGRYEEKFMFEDVSEFLQWFGIQSDIHHKNQTDWLENANRYKLEKLCVCFMPTTLCCCLRKPDTDMEQLEILSENYVGDVIDFDLHRVPKIITDETVSDVIVQGMKTRVDGSRYYCPDVPPEVFSEVSSEVSSSSYDSSDDMDIFREPDEAAKPWRPKMHSGPPREYHFILSYKFQKRYGGEKKYASFLQEFAQGELPTLMRLGWTNTQIYDDYVEFMKYRIEDAEISEMGIMSGILFQEITGKEEVVSWGDVFLTYLIDFYFSWSIVRSTAKYFGKYELVRRSFVTLMRPSLVKTKNQKYFMTKVGGKIDEALQGTNKWVKLGLSAVVAAVSIGLVVKIWSQFSLGNGNQKKEPKSEMKVHSSGYWYIYIDDKIVGPYIVRGNHVRSLGKVVPSVGADENSPLDKVRLTSYELPFSPNSPPEEEFLVDSSLTPTEPPTTEAVLQTDKLREVGKHPEKDVVSVKTNYWSQSERTVTSIDFLPGRAMNEEAFNKKLLRNVLRFETKGCDEKGNYTNQGHLIVLSNECFLTNNHSLPLEHDLQFSFHFDKNFGVRPSVQSLIAQSQIMRIPSRDIAVVTTKSLPALFKDLSPNFVKESFNGIYDGFYLIKNEDGSFEKLKVNRIERKHYRRLINGTSFDLEIYAGVAERETDYGHCGAPLIMLTGYGPVIVGFHAMLTAGNVVMASKFSFEDLKEFSTEMKVQCGVIPVETELLYQAPKSYVDFHPEGELIYHGELRGFRSRPKHHVFKTELSSQLFEASILDYTIKDRLTGPVMDSWRPQQVALAQFIKPVAYMKEPRLDECKRVFKRKVLAELSKSELEKIHPVPIDVAVNGKPGVDYMDAIKLSTSMGYPYKTTKRKYVIPLDDPRWPEGVRFTDEIEQEILMWYNRMEGGERCHGIFSANLKDEPVSWKKYEMGKTRVFFSGPVVLLVIVRMMFMGFCRVVQRNNYIFMCAVGMNCHSMEWDELFKFLSRFGVNTAIAGDYAFFDKKIKMMLVRYAMEFIIEICEESGNFTEAQVMVMKCIMFDLMNPTVDYFGMLMTLLGGEVSGHQLTTIFNCFMNILYQMYMYGEAGYDVSDFFDYIVSICLGDDHVICVSSERPLFTHTFIKEKMLELGVDYTMADKESVSRPYINLYEASFLKRTFRYDVGLGVHVGPIDKETIGKMLTIQVASKSCSKSEQLAQAITSASMEAFLHGREFFDAFHVLLNSLEKSESLLVHMKEFRCFTWEENLARFWKTDTRATVFGGGRNQNLPTDDSDCLDLQGVLQSRRSVDYRMDLAGAFPEAGIYQGARQDTKKNTKDSWNESSNFLDKYRLSKTTEQTNNIQSDVPETEGSVTTEVQQTTFFGETVPEMMDLSVPHDPTTISQLTDYQLNQYMGRASKIFTFTWPENNAPGTLASFNPINLFFNLPQIKNKLEGYRYAKFDLYVKFTVNGSPFYYGSLGAFLTMMNGYIADTTGATIGYAPGTQVLTSQKQHVWLDPQTTSAAEMHLPFLYNQNWVDMLLLNNLTNLAKIDLVQFAALRSANGVTTAGINVVVYAWAENVELTGLTSRPVLQSKKEYMRDGQISGPASTVAGVAKKLSSIPVIAPFAKATDVVASALGDVASYFGYTNVPNVRDVEPFKSVPFHTLASSSISEPINKLSLQPKQEIAVGGYAAGDPFSDPLHIANFCQRESFLCGALWTTTDAEDKIIFTSSVTPELYERNPITYYNVYMTPMCYMFNLFNYWRGDIIFRFKVIKSQYHRGRLNICWDVGVLNSALMPGYGNPSVLNIVFDIEETDEIEVRVPYMQALPFLKKLNQSGMGNNNTVWSNGPTPTFTGVGNGTIQTRVVNRLTAPEASSDVDLLVFVRAAENIEFAGPVNLRQDYSHIALQSKKIYDEVTFGKDSISDVRTYDSHFGEKIVSARELLHRQSKIATWTIPIVSIGSSTQEVVNFPFQRMPQIYGYQVNGMHSAFGITSPATTFNFNYVQNHPLVYLSQCFVGYKGSVNYNFNSIQFDAKSNVSCPSVGVTRLDGVLGTSKVQVFVPSQVSDSQAAKDFTGVNADPQGGAGTALTNQVTQSGIAVNLPYYSRFKFFVNNYLYAYSTSLGTPVSDESALDWYKLYIKRGVSGANSDMDSTIDVFCGTGPDFDLVYFMNCPVLYRLPPPPARQT
jgi:hypothetical protein